MWHSKTLQFEAEAKKGSSADEAYERRKPIVHMPLNLPQRLVKSIDHHGLGAVRAGGNHADAGA